MTHDSLPTSSPDLLPIRERAAQAATKAAVFAVVGSVVLHKIAAKLRGKP